MVERGPPVTVRPHHPNRPLLAAGFMAIAAVIIGFTDNFVRLIAEDHGLWQFHAVRSALALPMMLAAAPVLGMRLRPRRWGGVIARSAVMSTSMVVYFGCLAFLSVAEVAAALFTAPIFVLLISRFAFGQRFGVWRLIAVLLGFGGIVLMLDPGAGAVRLVALAPIGAAVLYAISNIATREWCGGESAATLTLGFFAALGLWGLAGLALAALVPHAVPVGADGFILRGWTAPDAQFWEVSVMQAAGSLIGVGLMVRAYQTAEASQVAVFEYLLLIASAIWGRVLWGQTFGAPALIGMAAIIAAGSIIALRSRFTPAGDGVRLPA
ncbi:MAG: EamA family transporter [Rhodobacteraceae bacterium]|nr:EamA family transporter [Paracoccaceae bacterium]